MTNGEKFKEVFGFGADGSRVIAVNATWWDCEFQNSKPMNDELVKQLRERGQYITEDSRLLRKAADTIEELSKRETPMEITEIHVDEYYCPACGAENNCDQGYVQDAFCPVCGQRLLPELPKEET